MNDKSFESIESPEFLEARNKLSSFLMGDIEEKIVESMLSSGHPWSAAFRNIAGYVRSSYGVMSMKSKKISIDAIEQFDIAFAELSLDITSDLDVITEDPDITDGQKKKKAELIQRLKDIGTDILVEASK